METNTNPPPHPLEALLAAVREAAPLLRYFEGKFASSLSCDSRSHDDDRKPRMILNVLLAALAECEKASENPSPQKLYAVSLAGVNHAIRGHTRLWAVMVAAESPDEAIEQAKAEIQGRGVHADYDFAGSLAVEITNTHIDRLNAINANHTKPHED